MKNKKIIISSIIVLILIFLAAGYIFKSYEAKKLISNAKANYSLLVREHSKIIGNKDAKVELVEFFDPACKTCAYMYPLVKEIMKKNEGKIKLVLRYAPFHPGSKDVVRMLEATKGQDKYIDVLELLFRTQNTWTINHHADLNILWEILIKSELLDMNKLVDDIKNQKLIQIVDQDIADAKDLKINKTPSYFVNGQPLKVFGLKNLKDLINSEL